MQRPGHAEIREAWNLYEAKNPDRSWEWMSARVIDHFDHQIDVADIADALTPADQVKGRFRPEVRVVNDPTWYSNARRFDTRQAAEKYVEDLMLRWTAVVDTRVVEE